MDIVRGHYENARRASDHARRRAFAVRAQVHAARVKVESLEAALIEVERDLAATVAAEVEARRQWVARSARRRQRRTSGGVVTAFRSLAAALRERTAAVTVGAAHAQA